MLLPPANQPATLPSSPPDLYILLVIKPWTDVILPQNVACVSWLLLFLCWCTAKLFINKDIQCHWYLAPISSSCRAALTVYHCFRCYIFYINYKIKQWTDYADWSVNIWSIILGVTESLPLLFVSVIFCKNETKQEVFVAWRCWHWHFSAVPFLQVPQVGRCRRSLKWNAWICKCATSPWGSSP